MDMPDLNFMYISFFITIGSFLVGFLIAWNLKDTYDTWVERADYARAVIHPEMYDSEGNFSQEEMIYLRFPEDSDTIEDENEE